MYLYCGMADVARETGDTVMAEHCDRLFHDVTDSQMYITGGIGTTAVLEAYTYPYDLPNDTMYAETCASIGLCFFARRMLGLKNDRAYADTVERCVYNILPAAISQDGCHYFYVNPLEVSEEACLKSPLKTHVKSRRQSWYECACCPPNLARMLASLPQYLYTVEDRRVNIHLYAQSEAEIELNDGRLRISQMTDYPFGGRIVHRQPASAGCGDSPSHSTVVRKVSSDRGWRTRGRSTARGWIPDSGAQLGHGDRNLPCAGNQPRMDTGQPACT